MDYFFHEVTNEVKLMSEPNSSVHDSAQYSHYSIIQHEGRIFPCSCHIIASRASLGYLRHKATDAGLVTCEVAVIVMCQGEVGLPSALYNVRPGRQLSVYLSCSLILRLAGHPSTRRYVQDLVNLTCFLDQIPF
jgi:hypothetical protein